jgi:exonuclease III
MRLWPRTVKIETFNINSVNKRLNNLLAWLAKAEPDVVRFWNGVAILA